MVRSHGNPTSLVVARANRARLVLLFVAIAWTIGCVRVSYQVIGKSPAGMARLAIDCNQTISHCYAKANDVCLYGYDVVEAGGHDSLVESSSETTCATQGTSNGYVSLNTNCKTTGGGMYTVYNGTLIVDCRPPNGEESEESPPAAAGMARRPQNMDGDVEPTRQRTQGTGAGNFATYGAPGRSNAHAAPANVEESPSQ